MLLVNTDLTFILNHTVDHSGINELLEDGGVSSESRDDNAVVRGESLLLSTLELFSSAKSVRKVSVLPGEEMLSGSRIEFNIGLGSFLLLSGVILDSLPPRDIVLGLKATLKVVVVVQVVAITHVFVHPGEGLVLMIDCDLAPEFGLNFLSDEVHDLVEDSYYRTNNTERHEHWV
jgi:hypothetical protein